MLTFTLDPIAIGQIVLAVGLPVLVGLVTTRVTASRTKAILLAVLALVTSLLAEALRAWQAGEAYDVGIGLLAAIPTLVIAIATQYGIWKPTGVTDAVQSLGRHAR